MSLKIKIVETKKQLREFIYLPAKLHVNHAQWVPPIYMDEFDFYNPKKNRALNYSDTILALAYDDSKLVGRIMGIINHQFNQQANEKQARFFNLDCVDDISVCKALIEFVEQWALQKSMNKIIGPFGFSDKDPQGFQFEGFEHLPVLAAPTNQSYMNRLIEQCGYSKQVDCVSYLFDVPVEIPNIYEKIFERVKSSGDFELKEFTKRSELKNYIVPVFRLINETYKHIFGFVPMDEIEMQEMAAKYLYILDPQFVKLITLKNNTPVAFVIAMPDLSKGIQKSKGKLFPFGIFHILRSAKKTDQLDLLLGAVDENYRSRGLTACLAVMLFKSSQKRNFKKIDSHLILETNTMMRREVERLGAMVYKRYRIYQKSMV